MNSTSSTQGTLSSSRLSEQPRWLIIGHGMVSMRFLQDVVSHRDRVNADITVISAEAKGGYNRIGLSDVLVGKRSLDSLDAVEPGWFDEQGISVKTGQVVHIDRPGRRVVLASGEELVYDRLIFATGSRPRVPNVPGVDWQGVQAFRTRDDLERMRTLPTDASAVVLGGGLLGLEAAVGLVAQGLAVTVVHRGDWLMNRQLDQQAGEWLAGRLQSQGIDIVTGAEAEAILSVGSDSRASGVRLSTGATLTADTVVLAIGIEPRTELASDIGLSVDGGIVVDDTLTTTDPRIHALGECASHRGVAYGLVSPLYAQSRVLADRLCGGDAVYTGSSVATQLKVSGVPVFAAGDVREHDDTHSQLWMDRAQRTYKKLIFRDNRLVGAVLYGDVADGKFYHDLISAATDISSIRPWLTFGPQFCALEPAATGAESAADTHPERANETTVQATA